MLFAAVRSLYGCQGLSHRGGKRRLLMIGPPIRSNRLCYPILGRFHCFAVLGMCLFFFCFSPFSFFAWSCIPRIGTKLRALAIGCQAQLRPGTREAHQPVCWRGKDGSEDVPSALQLLQLDVPSTLQLSQGSLKDLHFATI